MRQLDEELEAAFLDVVQMHEVFFGQEHGPRNFLVGKLAK